MQSSHGEQAANELQAVREEIRQLKAKVTAVEDQAEADPALKLALLQQLPGLRQELGALRQKEERLAAAEAAAAAAARSGATGGGEQGAGAGLGGLAESSDPTRLKALEAQVQDLTVRYLQASCTTRTHRDMGEEVRAQRAPVSERELPLVPLHEQDARVTAACNEVLRVLEPLPSQRGAVWKRIPAKKRRLSSSGQPSASGADGEEDAEPEELPCTELPGLTLADITRPHSMLPGFKEEDHMQPAAMKVLMASAGAVKCDAPILDTHTSGLASPDAKPDATSLASPAAVPAWPQVVYTWEFKLGTSKTERNIAAGQLLQRSAAVFDAQKDRHTVIGVLLTMNSIEIFVFKRDVQGNGQVQTYRTDLLPFSISPESPGFRLLVRVLCTPQRMLHFHPAALPTFASVGDCPLEGEWQLIRRGSGKDASHVFLVKPAATSAVVVKLNPTAHEAEVLRRLGTQGVPHTVKLLGVEHGVQYAGASWTAIAITPYAQHLTSSASLQLFTQVAYDVTVALKVAWKRCRTLQRDVTPNNFGHINSRGMLFDFSAGKVMPDDPPPESAGSSPRDRLEAITGTLLWAPTSVLCKQPHTPSSQLEGLFMSLVYIAADGRVCGHGWAKRLDPEAWAGRRVAQFSLPQLRDQDRVARHLLPLVQALHGLFWPTEPDQLLRKYRRNVTCQEVLDVCLNVCPAIQTEAVLV